MIVNNEEPQEQTKEEVERGRGFTSRDLVDGKIQSKYLFFFFPQHHGGISALSQRGARVMSRGPKVTLLCHSLEPHQRRGTWEGRGESDRGRRQWGWSSLCMPNRSWRQIRSDSPDWGRVLAACHESVWWSEPRFCPEGVHRSREVSGPHNVILKVTH